MQQIVRMLGLALAFGCAAAVAADRPATTKSREAATETVPDAKANAAADRTLLASVRRLVVKDKSLSVAAHNVKMSVNGGVFRASGSVKSAEEIEKIQAHAKSVAGITDFENKLTVKGARTEASAKPARTTTERAEASAKNPKTPTKSAN